MIPDVSKIEEEKSLEPETIMINTSDNKNNGSKSGNTDPPTTKTKQKLVIPAIF